MRGDLRDPLEGRQGLEATTDWTARDGGRGGTASAVSLPLPYSSGLWVSMGWGVPQMEI